GPAIADVMGGQVDFMFGTVAATYPLVSGGKLRALAVSAPERSRRLPDVPTVAEAAIPGYEAYEWNGVFLPAGTPAPVVARLNELLTAATRSAAAKSFYETAGSEPWTTTSDELARFQAGETQKWGKVIKAAGIEPE
uniref:Bug family tripartite tricarboxylate transporter substrate binding protein n=1 Tax=Pseudomonas sp. 18058 TaxID=2681406 RepID=UPI002114A8BE